MTVREYYVVAAAAAATAAADVVNDDDNGTVVSSGTFRTSLLFSGWRRFVYLGRRYVGRWAELMHVTTTLMSVKIGHQQGIIQFALRTT